MINKTTLSSGVDIPFIEAQLTIHPPTLREISFIGEDTFFIGCELLNCQKKDFLKQGNFDSKNLSNFDILMSIMNDRTKDTKSQREKTKQVLNLIFPKYEIFYTQDQILFVLDQNTLSMNKKNYDSFQSIINDLFMLDKHNKKGNQQQYNPADDKANAIAEKLYKARDKVAKQKGEDTELFILGKYADILSIGLGIDRNVFNNYTVWQLYNAFDRYMLKYNWDLTMKCKLAGASKVEDVENWMN